MNLTFSFEDPIAIGMNSMCSIPMQSNFAKPLQKAKLIVWDEALAQHQHCVEAVDQTLCDIIQRPNLPLAVKWLFLEVISDNVRKWCLEVLGQQSFLWPFRVWCCGVKCPSSLSRKT
jgi:hypothetical protein